MRKQALGLLLLGLEINFLPVRKQSYNSRGKGLSVTAEILRCGLLNFLFFNKKGEITILFYWKLKILFLNSIVSNIGS